MATTPTQDAVPSESPRDLKFNAGKIDEFVTSLARQYIDRFGQAHYTVEGLRKLAQEAISTFGWITLDSFQDGAVLTLPNQVLRDKSTGEYYRWDGDFPKVVALGSTPEISGGVGTGAWISVGDAALRQMLATTAGASLVGTNSGETVQEKLDVADEFMLANDSSSFRSKNISKLSSVNYKIRTRQALSVLFQGDSITAGYDVTTTDSVDPENGDWARHAAMTYPKRFVAFMAEQIGVTVTPVYRAISGYTAKDAVDNADWQQNPNCDLAFIMYGINDSNGMHGATYAEYMVNMEKLIRRLINWGAGVVVMTCATGGQGIYNENAQIWVEQVKNMATVYGCRHFDAHEVQYNRLNGTVQSDAIHFNSMGYAKIGEALTSMCGAGGLLESYESVKHEVQVWPGAQDKHIGYCNPQKNVSIIYNAATYTNPGITGTMPAGQRCVISFHFYQDCEALDVDLIGSWDDGGLTCIMNNWYSPGTVPYYPLAAGASNERNLGFRQVFTTQTLNNQDSSRNGPPKFVGSLYGKGWKTITIFNLLNGTSPNPQYIQMLSVRPSNLRKSNPNRKGFQLGDVGVTRIMIPDSARGTVPDATAFSSTVLPLPDSLKGMSRDNKVAYFDCASAKVIIKAIAGTFGTHYMEGVIYKSSVSVDTFNFLITTQTGAAAEWPVFTFAKTQKQPSSTYTANQLGLGMPAREIIYSQSDVANGNGRPDMGDWLTITANWTAVSGGAKTSYWSIELWGMDFNGSPMISAI